MSAGWLLDTSVLSSLAPYRPVIDTHLADWLRARAESLYLSAVTVVEIEQGVRKLRRAGGADRADRLTAWLDVVIAGSGDRILSLDRKVSRIAGALSDQALAAGRHPGFADIAIAATALAHDLVLLTRNAKHFGPLGVHFTDPADLA
ncbi:MAG: type II toxin-antitoxin system VapC family toxin [Caulobacteraceae bacterium]